MLNICREVQRLGVPNYAGLRIQLPSKFNFDFISIELKGFPLKKVLIDFLKFGFPLGNTKKLGSNVIPKNHTGATQFGREMQRLLNKEVQNGATLGPFKSTQLPNTCFSPLNSVPKKDSADRRLILDLSYPDGGSINDGIDKDWCFGFYDKLELPSIDALANRVAELGSGCLLFKVDLIRAFRQMKICPGEVHFLCYCFNNGYYYDCTLSMGSKSSSKACQYVTTAVVFIFTRHGFFAINYLDDLGSAEREDRAFIAYDHLLQLLNNFGLDPAPHKCIAPCTCLTFLGIEVNTVNMTLTIPAEKWHDIQNLLQQWSNKQTATLRDTQVLAGSLNFACKCVRGGRVYLSRILNFLRTLPRFQARSIPPSVQRDINWWVQFAPLFNGVSMILDSHPTDIDELFSSDSCLTGGGCYLHGTFVHWEYPPEITQMGCNINQLECLMVVVAAQVAAENNVVKRKRLVIHCDNKNSVLAINSGSSRDSKIQSCLRKLHVITSLHSFDITAVFRPGVQNRISDSLSRWHLGQSHVQSFRELTAGQTTSQAIVRREHFDFFLMTD